MSDTRLGLRVISVPEPCTQPWNRMTGDDKIRFCAHCQNTVTDLSAMTLAEAEKAICQAGGNLCVRFQRSADGQVVSLDYQTRPRTNRWLPPAVFSAAVAVAGSVFASMFHFYRPPRPTMMMGAMSAQPIPPATQPLPKSGAMAPASLDDSD